MLPDNLVRGMHEVLFNFEYYRRLQFLRHLRTQQTEKRGTTDHDAPIELPVPSWDQPSSDGGHNEQNDAEENDERDMSGVRFHVNYPRLRLQQR